MSLSRPTARTRPIYTKTRARRTWPRPLVRAPSRAVDRRVGHRDEITRARSAATCRGGSRTWERSCHDERLAAPPPSGGDHDSPRRGRRKGFTRRRRASRGDTFRREVRSRTREREDAAEGARPVSHVGIMLPWAYPNTAEALMARTLTRVAEAPGTWRGAWTPSRPRGWRRGCGKSQVGEDEEHPGDAHGARDDHAEGRIERKVPPHPPPTVAIGRSGSAERR